MPARRSAVPTSPAALDVSGRELAKGDTVATLNGQMTGRVWELNVEDDGMAFVQVRPVHQPYAQAVWYAADQLIWVATPGSGSSANSKNDGSTGGKPASTTKQPADKNGNSKSRASHARSAAATPTRRKSRAKHK